MLIITESVVIYKIEILPYHKDIKTMTINVTASFMVIIAVGYTSSHSEQDRKSVV